MNLQFFDGKFTDNYAWELTLFHGYREFKDGIDFFDFNIKYDKYIRDHNPRFEFNLRILNTTIFDFSIYNIWHTDNPNSPYYGMEDEEIWDTDEEEWDEEDKQL